MSDSQKNTNGLVAAFYCCEDKVSNSKPTWWAHTQRAS